MTYPKALSLFIFLVFLSAAIWSLSSPVLADNLGEKANSAPNALAKARKFHERTGGVGIVLSYGQNNGASADEVGSTFASAITKRGFPARYFYFTIAQTGLAMTFVVSSETEVGPLNAQGAAREFGRIIRLAELDAEMAKQRKTLKDKYGEDYIGGMADELLGDDGKDNR